MNATSIRSLLLRVSVLVLVLGVVVISAEQPGLRAPLQSVKDRKDAAELGLEDSTGKVATLRNYRGKVLLVDFWATWCTGCKHEIPWFAGFQSAYGAQGLAVVGVAVDNDGWKAVRPFLAETKVPYRIVMGNDATMQRFGIDSLPDTFLIDRHGRVAAAYKAGLVDRDDIEANIKALLLEH
jgi:cytochrome c biogenesis protein CcmG/thiol:disulfide interchange protein DsbE